MTTITEDGTTKKITRRNDDSFFQDSTEGLGIIERNSCIDGDEQDSVNYSNSSREVGFRSIEQPKDSPGKILERLKLLETQYLSHLEQHQKQLGNWLDESHETEKHFKLAVKELEEEIRELISDENQQLHKSQDKS